MSPLSDRPPPSSRPTPSFGGRSAARFRFFPVSYDVDGRAVAVVGSGDQALQKLRLLVRSKARLVLFAADPHADLAAFAAEHGVRHVAAEPTVIDLRGAALAFVASGEEREDARIAALARDAGVPVNVVDRPHLSDFAVPAIVDRAPVSIAIATDGFAPVLAQRVRALIDTLLPPAFGRLASLAAAVREVSLARLASPEARRRFWSRLFDGPAADAALAGDAARAQRLALASIDAETDRALTGKVFLVGAGPGAEDLLTLRAHRLLLEADVIVHDALVPTAVVDMGRRDAERIAVGKRKGHHSAEQADIDGLLVALARDGKRVVRLKAGDPLIFGRAGEEIEALRRAGVAYEIVPGVTAALAAASGAAIPLTLRGVASALVFSTGHEAGGADLGPAENLALGGTTIALYMGKSNADRLAARFIAAGLSAATPAAAVENAGRPDERLLAGTLADLPALAARSDLTGPVLVLIGPAVAHGDLARAEPFAGRPLSLAA